MESFAYLFSNLKIIKSANGFSDVITSFDYRITLMGSGKAVCRYGNAFLSTPPSGVQEFIAFKEIDESTMINFLRQSMSGQLEKIEEEMQEEIIAISSMPVEVSLPWESKEGQDD
jgi:hypothetical protein